jgi:hypothetical protein
MTTFNHALKRNFPGSMSRTTSPRSMERAAAMADAILLSEEYDIRVTCTPIGATRAPSA